MEVVIHMELYKEDELFLSKEGLSGNFLNNQLCFTYDNMEHVISYSEKEMTFQRESNDYFFSLCIKEEPECTFLLKETNTLLNIHVEKANFTIQEQSVDFEYCIETDDALNRVVITWKEKEG